MNDVPRTATGWPTVDPTHFTLPQLIREARKWRGGEYGTLGYDEWQKYSGELVRRGYSSHTEIQERILPDEVQRRERPSWWSHMDESVHVVVPSPSGLESGESSPVWRLMTIMGVVAVVIALAVVSAFFLWAGLNG